ncbi:MAG: twin-arginine translocation signal domain-containing protein [Thermoguttaceae bacterium]|jgi:predicted dehydrogenase
MSNHDHSASRRDFLKNTGKIAAATALAGVLVPPVHAGEDNTIRVALIGCGGRGSGAAGEAMSVKHGPVKLVAMADVFQDRLDDSVKYLNSEGYADRMDVPKDRQFVGFDAYKKAMDCLRPGDVAIFTTVPAFRWVDFSYAIEKGLNVFMEKPVAVDGPSARKMFALTEKSKAKNLKVAVGLMSRHAKPLQELAKRIHDGQIGDPILLRGYRMHDVAASFRSGPKPANISELDYQIRRFHSFLWASGGCVSDYYIHIIDNCCWMKHAWPVKAEALGGRHYRQAPDGAPYIDQNFDIYSIEYTFADGAKFIFDGRCMPGCEERYYNFVHGSKGIASISKTGDCGAPSAIYKGQQPDAAHVLWQSKTKPGDQGPYQNEWNDLVEAIRSDKPYNEASRGIAASLVTAMGRMAAHTGQEITYDQMLNCPHEFAPNVDKLTKNSPAPLLLGANGKYPVPMPGIVTKREY